jgi:NitT/TauT family transport system substrate-binding protein
MNMKILANRLCPSVIPLLTAAVIGLAAGSAAAADETKLKFRLNYVPSGSHSPFFLAVQKGWYKEAGVDVEILDGRGSAQTISLVAAGQDDVGYTDLTALTIAKVKGIPVKAIAALIRTSGQGVIVHRNANLSKPEDFRGKEIIYNNAGAAEQALFAGFLATAGMKASDVKLVGVDSASKEAAILSEKGDAAVAPLPYLQALLEGKREFKHIKFSDFGQRLLDIGLIANETVMKEKPQALKAFLAVTAKAYAYALDGHMGESVDAMIAMRQDAKINREQAINYLRYNEPLMGSPSTVGKPIGYMSAQNWEDMVENLVKVGLMPAGVKPTDLYDPSFQPQ